MAKVNNNSTADRELVISRVLSAPRELVFDTWTDAKHVSNWYGPDGFTVTTQKMDVSVGGEWIFTMHGPDGTDYPNRQRYTEVVKSERLAYLYDEGIDNDPAAMEVIVTFEDEGGKTKLTMRTLFKTAEEKDRVVAEVGAIEGGNQTLNRFETILEQAQDEEGLVITRTFNAPRELVFKVWRQAEHLAKWWGPAGMQLAVHQLEFNVGGTFLYSMEAPNGFKMWGKFIYKEIAAPERIVFISSFSDKDGNTCRAPFFDGKWALEVLNVLTLTEQEGKTLLTLKGGPINATAEERQLYKETKSSMQDGFGGTFAQLDTYLAEII